MKGSIFNTFFTLLAMFALSLSFVNAQKTTVSKTTSANKTKTVTKPVTPAKSTITAKTTPANISSSSSKINIPTPVNFKIPAKEQAILDEINAVRDNPQKYIEYLQDYRKLFRGTMLYVPGETVTETNEGVAAVDEAIAFLKTAAKLPPYNLSKGLTASANLQLKDLMENSSINHIGKDGSSLAQRLARFGEAGNSFAENISFYAKTPRDVVLTMLIDDGIKSRNHRKNVLSSTFKVIGLGFGNGKNGEVLCVINFADSFKDK